MKETIKFENVYFNDKNGNTVLKNLSFTLKKGDNLALLGESNTGKTLILKLISGLVKPTRGKIYIFQKEISKLSENKLFQIQKKIGLLFQNNALFDDLTCLDNIIFPLLRRNIPIKEAIPKAKKLLKKLSLENIENLYPDELSGGMKKRVALARMMIYSPEILLYDDPTAGLDPITAIKIYEMIKNNQKENKTSIIISQDIKNILSITNKIIIIENSNIIFQGNRNELKSSQNERIKNFLPKL